MCESRFTKALLLCVILLLACSFTSAPLMGQAVSARLEGRVMDPTQAVVPGVTLTATNEATNIAIEAVTNESGRYIFANLTAGTYTVSAALSGFKTTVIKGIVLQIGDAKNQDLTLQMGNISETVTVIGEATLVNTSSTRVGAVVQDRQALDLPLNGRDAMMLFYLQAGTSPLDRYGNQQQMGVVDGLEPHASSVKVEGILASNPGFDYSPSHPSTPVPQEAVGEYRVSTSGEMADGGRASGAQVKVLIKSGTNNFHGSLFEFNRNTAYNANSFFSNRAGTAKPVLRRNQFGFALGGPIIKNRTFFFGTAEWQRQNEDVLQNRTTYTSTVRSGIFRYWKKGANSGSLVDSKTGNPTVPDSDIGTINLVAIDPTRQGFDTVFLPKLLAALPPPNNYDIGDGFNTAGFFYSSPRPDDQSQWLFKVDHELSKRNHLAVSYSAQHENQPQPQQINRVSMEGYEEKRRGLSIRLVSALTPKLTNELSLGANRRLSLRPITNPDQLSPKGNLQFIGLGNSGGLSDSNGNIMIVRSVQRNPAVNMGFQDNATWVKGNHTLSWGGEYWRQTLNSIFGTGDFPIIRTTNADNPATIPATVAGINTVDKSRAQQLVNDLTGTIGSISQTFYLSGQSGYVPYVSNYQQHRKLEWSLFLQDIWKVRPNFTLNLGLRYEMLPPIWMANGLYAYPINGVDGALGIQGPLKQPTQWGLAPNNGRDVFNTEKTNFAPTVGFSWDPFGDSKTAVSGSYRIAYDRFMMVTGNFSSSNYGASTAVTLTPFTRLSDPKLYGQILPVPIPQLFAPLGFDRLSRAYVVDPNLRTPYVQSWSFGIERQISKDWKIGAVYVGNHAVGIWRAVNLNQIEMRKNGFLDAFKIAQSNLAASGGKSITGQSLGALDPLFKLVPSSQFNLITQGQAAALADYLDTTTQTTGKRGGLVSLAGLPVTFFRFNPQVQNLNIGGNRSHTTWDGLKLSVNRRLQSGLYFQANYTLSKGFADTILGQSLADDFRDIANTRLDKGLSPLDATHVMQLNGIWELPVGKGKRYLAGAPSWIHGFLGGWQMNGIFNWTTGRPISFTTGRYNLNQNRVSTPNYNGTWSNFTDITKGDQITFMTSDQKAAFTNPGAGEAGGLPYYNFHGPGGLGAVDMSFFKSFQLNKIKEGVTLQFRAELFNIMNHVSFQAPSSTATNINGGTVGVLTSAYPARIGQFALKLTF